MKFSNLLGKNIINLSHAKELGTVYNCTVDNKLRHISQIATVDNDENEGYIQNRLINFGEDVLYTVNTLADYEQKGILFPFRARVFDTDGKYFGKVSDFEFEKNQILEIQIGKDLSIKTSEIVTASNNLVIVKGKRKVRACTPQTKRAKPPISTSFTEVQANSDTQTKNDDYEPKMLELATIEDYEEISEDSLVASDEITQDVVDEHKETPLQESNIKERKTTVNETNDKKVQPDQAIGESPRKLISGYQFLLGRKVIKNIIQGSMLLIPKDKTIDVDTVELARKYGKLVELTVSSIEK